jgi:hypothetical protein
MADEAGDEGPTKDEGRHQPASDLLWNESWYLDFATADGDLGGYIRLGLYPNLGVSWFWACLVGEDRPLVTVIDNEAPLPTPPALELRASGLWADLIVETPMTHMTVGLEAFGVAMDDPTEVYRRGWGDRIPLGFDLEWETDGSVFHYDVTSRYEVPCRVHGDILVGSETIDFDGVGQRDHSWGVRDWWSMGWCWNAGRLEDGTPFHSTIIDEVGFSIGYLGADATPLEVAAIEATYDADGFATAAGLSLDGLDVAVEPVAWSPVSLLGPDGRVSRFPRALSRYRAADGRAGVGWIEFNQPQ